MGKIYRVCYFLDILKVLRDPQCRKMEYETRYCKDDNLMAGKASLRSSGSNISQKRAVPDGYGLLMVLPFQCIRAEFTRGGRRIYILTRPLGEKREDKNIC